jgi:hypothetical protein
MRTIPYLTIFIFLVSCKHESDNMVIIGDNSSNYTIIKPDPALLISISNQDSLDLNSDGIFEIKFKMSPIPTSTGFGSKTEIFVTNNLQILLSSMNELPDTLSIKSLLKNDSNWSDPSSNLSTTVSSTFLLQSYACYTYLHCLGSGNFRDVSGKYIGYKMKEKFGWILVNSSNSEFKIKEFVVLK